jgi:hypothetical protein
MRGQNEQTHLGHSPAHKAAGLIQQLLHGSVHGDSWSTIFVCVLLQCDRLEGATQLGQRWAAGQSMRSVKQARVNAQPHL